MGFLCNHLRDWLIDAHLIVKVPQWSIKPITGRLAIEMEENLDDEVFTKRHLKHELDEKRRKR